MTQALTSALLHFVWQGTAVAFLLWMALGLLRNRSANARYVVSCAALGLMAVLPSITAWMVYQRPVIATATEILAAVPREAVAASFQAEHWLLPAWSLGVLLFSLRLLWGCRQVSAIRRRGEPADATLLAMVAAVAVRMKLDRPVRVLISSVAQGPSAIGWIRPVILLPAATVLGLTTQQLEAVIAHELAHVRRHDYLVNIIQMLVETVLFYHPAVWWTSARIRHERELCCDDAAVGCCGDALCYARALTTLERLRITTPRLAVGSTGGSMLYRIERLVGVAKYQNAPSRWPGVLAICLGLVVFALNSNWAQGQARPKVVDEPGVKTDLGKSTVTDRTPVEYPEAALEKKVQGTVVVEATVDQTGAVNDARVVSGPQELRKAALQSVLEWHFTPESGGSKRRVSIAFRTPPQGGPVPVEYQGRPYVYQGLGDQQQLELEQEFRSLKYELERQKKLERTQALPQVNQEVADLEKQQQIDEALQKLEELAKRQQQLKHQQQPETQGAAVPTPPPADAEFRAAVQDYEVLKAKLNSAQTALELEASRDSKGELAERQLQQARETTEFLRQQLVEQEQRLVELKAGSEQAGEQRIRGQIVIDCSPDAGRLACTAKPEIDERQQKVEEETQPRITEWEKLQRLRESQQGTLQEQVSRGAQLTEQLRALQAQMEALKAQADALKAQLQEQQKSQQK